MKTVKEALQAANCEPAIGGDLEFFDAVRAALPAFRGAELRTAAKGATADLIFWLLSDKPIGRSERVYLAELIAGTLHATGRQYRSAKQNQDDRDLAIEALAEKDRLVAEEGMSKTKAGDIAAKKAARDKRARNRSIGTIKRLMQDVNPVRKYLK